MAAVRFVRRAGEYGLEDVLTAKASRKGRFGEARSVWTPREGWATEMSEEDETAWRVWAVAERVGMEAWIREQLGVWVCDARCVGGLDVWEDWMCGRVRCVRAGDTGI